MAGTNPYAGGSIPSDVYTKKEEGYKSTIKEPTKEQKKNAKDAVNKATSNPATPGYVPSNVFTKKEEGYTTKGNIDKTRRTDKKTGALEKAGAALSNLGANLFGDRDYDYRGYSDEELEEMVKKNPGSADAIVAQKELNKRNEAAGMATKAVNVTNAQGGKDDMRFSSGSSIDDAKTFGDTKAKDVPELLRERGIDPATTSREEAAKILATDAPETSAPAPAPATNVGSGSGAAPSANTEPEAVSNGISTDEPTEDLSTPSWQDTDTVIEAMKNDINTRAAATPEMKSIWQAWKNGDIDKNTRNYFMADAIAKFAGDMGNISHAQHANNMWANIESGNQINPMENVKGENQWQDYLKTDWKEAQKLKNEARSKEQLGNIDNQLEVSKQRGFDQYLANEKPEILKDSKWAKMAKEDPDSYATLQQLGQMIDGKSPLTADQLGNLIDASGNAKLGNEIGQKQLEMLGLSKQQAEESLQALKLANEVSKATKDYQIAAQRYGVDSIQAQNAAMWAQTAGQNLANSFNSRTLDSRVKKGIYGGLGINAGPVNIDSGSAASILNGLGIPLPTGN